MDYVNIFKVLANEHRLNILTWLKDKEQYFLEYAETEASKDALLNNYGVCAGLIHRRTGLSQPTVSTYLKQLVDAGLITTKRYGMWTHYERNEVRIQKIAKFMQHEL